MRCYRWYRCYPIREELTLTFMLWTGDRLCRLSTLPGSDMMDRLDTVLPPSTIVALDEPRTPVVDDMGPGNRMSPDMIGRES